MRFFFCSALVIWCVSVCAIDGAIVPSLVGMAISSVVMAMTWRSMVRDGES